jgi:polysaccharide biosynthesis/export protein
MLRKCAIRIGLFCGIPAGFLHKRTHVTLTVAAVFAILVTGAGRTAQGQGNSIARTSPAGAVAISTADDTRYRIGPGDVLTILVRKAPELSSELVRVDQRGMIRIPMIDDEVQAACKTENELASQIATLYKEYKRSPSVDVIVRDYQSRPVAVIGAVMAPGQFRLQRQVRLLEMLSFAGGPSGSSGRVINIIHTGGPNVCEMPAAPGEAKHYVAGLAVYELNDTLKGGEDDNPFVRPGDIISLPEADQVFIVGHVFSPRAISLRDKTITLSRAIAMAGGPQRDAKTSKIHIIRTGADGNSKAELIVDLQAIQKRTAPDVVLLPNDIVEIPASTGKTILQALTGAIAPALTQAPIRAIP